MTPEERSKVGTLIAFTAQYYGEKFEREVISMMVSDLADLPANDVLAAYEKYRRDPKSKFFPRPGVIRGMIQPEVNHDAKAREIAGRIPAAIVKFGYSNPAEAQSFIGEVGWDVVQSSGGWSYLCQNHGVTIDPGQFMAQTRDRLRDRFEYGREAIHAQVIEHRPREQVIQIERDTQKARLEQWQLDEIEKNRKPDPNAAYLAKTPEERQAIIRGFLDSVKKV